MLEFLAKFASSFASYGANTASYFFMGQAKEPKEVSKLFR